MWKARRIPPLRLERCDAILSKQRKMKEVIACCNCTMIYISNHHLYFTQHDSNPPTVTTPAGHRNIPPRTSGRGSRGLARSPRGARGTSFLGLLHPVGCHSGHDSGTLGHLCWRGACNICLGVSMSGSSECGSLGPAPRGACGASPEGCCCTRWCHSGRDGGALGTSRSPGDRNICLRGQRAGSLDSTGWCGHFGAWMAPWGPFWALLGCQGSNVDVWAGCAFAPPASMEIAISVGEGRGLVHRIPCFRVVISVPGYLCGGLASLFGCAVAP
jgi:hypothetical protein